MEKTHLSAKEFFLKLNKNTMNLVDEFYDEHIVFHDPIVEIRDRIKVKKYYTNLYNNVDSISWVFPEEIHEGDRSVLTWKMTLTAKNFNSNKPVIVDGVSVIKFGGKENKAIYHRDYFDMGAFVYEGLPIIGNVIRFVKSNMASHQK